MLTPATLHGKVVVLRFSLGNLRDDGSQFMELLHRAYALQGVLALVVATSPDKDWAQNLVKEGYTFSTATDGDHVSARALGLNSSPGWVVIGRDGNVLVVGYVPQRQLALDLKQAGVW